MHMTDTSSVVADVIEDSQHEIDKALRLGQREELEQYLRVRAILRMQDTDETINTTEAVREIGRHLDDYEDHDR